MMIIKKVQLMSSMNRHKIMIQLQNIMKKKDNINLVTTKEEKCTSPFYWKRVHQLITSSTTNNDPRYGIYQVKEDNALCKYVENYSSTEGKTHILKNHVSVILDRFMDQPV